MNELSYSLTPRGIVIYNIVRLESLLPVMKSIIRFMGARPSDRKGECIEQLYACVYWKMSKMTF